MAIARFDLNLMEEKHCQCGTEFGTEGKGRYSDNEHPRSPVVWFCRCGKITQIVFKR